jgi:hypothetical protein
MVRAQAKENQQPLLIIAGPHEFLPYDSHEPRPSQEFAKALAQAYPRLGYDVGYAMREEQSWLASVGGALPPSFRVASERPAFEVIQVSGIKVGLLFLPSIDTIPGKAPSVVCRAVADRAAALRPQCDLVVAVSPWGAAAESDLLENDKPDIDLLLGAGPGPGFPARTARGEKTLWCRAYAQGRTVHVIMLKELPGHKPDWKWVRDANASVQLQSLSESITNDPDMDALLNGFKLEKAAH